jgi:hypothetical protein
MIFFIFYPSIDEFYGNNTNLQIDGMCRKQETYLIMRSQK